MSVPSLSIKRCPECKSADIHIRPNERFNFVKPNPGPISVNQTCIKCNHCGEEYFDDAQMTELSKKICAVK